MAAKHIAPVSANPSTFLAEKAIPPARATLAAALARVRAHLYEQSHRAVSLAEAAQVAGLSPGHLQRVFSAAFGCSPKAWHRQCRDAKLRAALQKGAAVSAAIYGAGYGSGSRVYESAGQRLGMTPGQLARAGSGVAMSYAQALTDLGTVIIAASDRGVCWVSLGDDPAEQLKQLRSTFSQAEITAMPTHGAPLLRAWLAIVMAAVAGRQRAADGVAALAAALPLAPAGTAFQLQVWDALQRIPAGEAWTYAQLASALGRPSAARAVARACATNPVAVLIPCHRVIRGDGTLAGYRWGTQRKAELLKRERLQSEQQAHPQPQPHPQPQLTQLNARTTSAQSAGLAPKPVRKQRVR